MLNSLAITPYRIRLTRLLHLLQGIAQSILTPDCFLRCHPGTARFLSGYLWS